MSKVELGLDASGLSAAIGYIDGLSEELETDRSIRSVVAYVQSELSRKFNVAVDLAAAAAPESFLHVYEWGRKYDDRSTIGSPRRRLWRLNSVGVGKNRVTNFVFLPSVQPVPINPILKGMVKEGVHVFTWKAPVLEYGIRVSISPIFAKTLVFVDNETDEIVRSKGPSQFAAGTSPYGNGSQKGMFTGFYIRWWSNEAVDIYRNELVPNIERNVIQGGNIRETTRRYQKKRKQFTIQTSIEGERTYGQAKINARQDIRKTVAEIHRRAAERRESLYGDASED